MAIAMNFSRSPRLICRGTSQCGKQNGLRRCHAYTNHGSHRGAIWNLLAEHDISGSDPKTLVVSPKCYCREAFSHSLTSVHFLAAEAGAGTAAAVTSLASVWPVLRVQVLQNLSRWWCLRAGPTG